MRKKTPGNRCLPLLSSSPRPEAEIMADTMETKLLCPTLSIMITKTIKALCEVNIRFEQKLEIGGCLHIRSDDEKVLSVLIDEETTRIKQEEGTANERHEPIVSMLNSTLATALQNAAGRSPIIPSMQEVIEEPPPVGSLEESIRIAVENSRNASSSTTQLLSDPANVQRLLGQVVSPESNKVSPLMIPERAVHIESGKSSPSTSEGEIEAMVIKKEVMEINRNVLTSSPAGVDHVLPPVISIAPQQFPGGVTIADPPQQGTPPPPQPPQPNAKNTVDNIPYETMEVISPKGSRTKKFQCMFCGIMLSTKGYLKNHINAVHTKARVYPCEICERLFYSAGALRIHKLRHHWAGSKKHKCHLCKDAFLLPIELRRHLLKKHNIPTEPNSPSPANNNMAAANHDDSSSEITEADEEAAMLEDQMKAAQQAAQAHLQMVQDMARISQQQAMHQEMEQT